MDSLDVTTFSNEGNKGASQFNVTQLSPKMQYTMLCALFNENKVLQATIKQLTSKAEILDRITKADV